MKKYLKIFILCIAPLFASLSVKAQYQSIDNDSTANTIPGRFFSTDSISNTGSVATVSGEKLGRLTSANLYNTLTGRLAGLFIKSLSQLPGSDQPALSIRGSASYGYGFSNNAKIFVDGFEVPMVSIDYLSPSEIESVSILKDAAALVTFGMEGANGVIWIKTKHGHIGESTTSIQIRSGIQKPIALYKPLKAYEFASLYNRAISMDNGKWTPKYSESQLQSYKNGTGTNVDWYDEVFRNHGTYSDINLVFNGGSEKGRYNVVLGYADQQGLFDAKNTDQTSNRSTQRFNLSSNLDFRMLKIVDVSVYVNGSILNMRKPNTPGSFINDIANYPSNIYPVHDTLAKEDELNYSGTSLFPNNPVGSLKGTGWSKYKYRRLSTAVKFKEDLNFITEGLALRERISFYTRSISSYSKDRNYARYFEGKPTTSDKTTSITAGDYTPSGMDQIIQGDISLIYNKDFGKNQLLSTVNFGAYTHLAEGIFGFQEHHMNVSGRINYSFDSRFVGEFGFSYFGSDAYASGNRWGFYPALSGAWIVSNESFLKDNNYINFLKLRASVGRLGESYTDVSFAGYDSHGRYLYKQYYGYSTPYYTGTSAPFTRTGSLKKSFTANQNIFAEKSIKYNVGIDLKLYNRLRLTADFFMDERSKILTNEHFLEYYGNKDFINNIGKAINKGIEVSATYTNTIGNLKYAINGTVFYAKNKIIFMDEVPTKYAYNALTEHSIGTILGLLVDGFYGVSDFKNDGSLKDDIAVPLFGKVQPGDIRYKDLDRDGFIDETDITKIGNRNPDLGYSFGGMLNYKGFDFSFLFQGQSGSSVSLLGSYFKPFVNNGNAFRNAFYAWTYLPDRGIDNRAIATFPRLTTQSNQNNYRNSDLWMRTNNYLRLKNVVIGYDFSKSLFKSVDKISEFTLFLNAVNPLTFSKLLSEDNYDPETGYGYPNLSSYYIGIKVTF